MNRNHPLPKVLESMGTEAAMKFGAVLNRNHHAVLFGLALIAVLVRLPLIDIPLQGDDYNSLSEATGTDVKINGWFFYELLGLWMRGGDSEAWLRVLPVAASIALIPVAYWLSRITGHRNRALLLPAFIAIAPYPFEVSIWVRHYSFYLTASMLSLTTFIFLQKKSGRINPGLFAAAAGVMVLAAASHLFGVFLAAALVLCLYLVRENSRTKQIRNLAVITFLGLVLGVLVALPSVRIAGWDWLETAINSLVRVPYADPRGLHVAQIVKILVSYYVFLFGDSVYPLTWWFVVPALSAAGIGLAYGIKHFWQTDRGVFFLVLAATLPMIFVYLIFEPLVPVMTETASPRHVLMAWPGFAFLLSAGMQSFKQGRYSWVLLLIAVVGLGFRYAGNWSYGQSGPDWRAIAEFINADPLDKTLILIDGRSENPAAFYFDEKIRKSTVYQFVNSAGGFNLDDFERVLVLSNDHKPENREVVNRAMAQIETKFVWQESLVEYPFFMYEFVRIPSEEMEPASIYQLRHPVRAYGLEFADLTLPVTAWSGGTPLIIPGAFEISDANPVQSLASVQTMQTNEILLVTNFIGSGDEQAGDVVATLNALGSGGGKVTFPLRLGTETKAWDQLCDSASRCETIHQWKKRVALVGQRVYPDAYREFTAGLHAVRIELPEGIVVNELVFERGETAGVLYVWGITLEGQ